MKDRDIEGEILAASFWENWRFAKELSMSKHSKSIPVFKEAEKIRQELIKHQQEQKARDG